MLPVTPRALARALGAIVCVTCVAGLAVEIAYLYVGLRESADAWEEKA